MKRLLFIALLPLACIPDLPDDTSTVRDARILAVQATPAEARPGLQVKLTALVAGEGRIAWGLCNVRKPLTELGPVAQACIDRFAIGDAEIARLPDGPEVTATIPGDVCRRFGPAAPPADASGVAGRPVDPDLTGGYYQPLVIANEAGTVLAQVRVMCGVTGVPNAESVKFTKGYKANENPVVESIDLPERTARGSRIDVHVKVNAPETYLWANPDTRLVEERREFVTVSWFATGGSFADVRSEGANTWTAPDVPGKVRLWVVARDDRGGVSWIERSIDVE